MHYVFILINFFTGNHFLTHAGLCFCQEMKVHQRFLAY